MNDLCSCLFLYPKFQTNMMQCSRDGLGLGGNGDGGDGEGGLGLGGLGLGDAGNIHKT